ncbi:Hypothetical protein Ccan_20410 [Capnocytophaga canimorsus Cc5]|uniref:Uncharacterized protein n=1 Tax=Capnocytophaga canimorsus (strain 5) TaxID=860228 RepID=F9YU39_CAPCC|nr:Hypothetical protein Ccan_20410 [Capnocytophaga canimorsus Cc5]
MIYLRRLITNSLRFRFYLIRKNFNTYWNNFSTFVHYEINF